MTKTGVEEYVEDPIHMRLYQQERAIYEVTELIESVMTELGVSRSELAKKLGQSKGWVTQLLDGEKNKTIRTVADVFAVLGREYRSFETPIQVARKPAIATQDSGAGELKVFYDPKDRYAVAVTASSKPATVKQLRAVK